MSNNKKIHFRVSDTLYDIIAQKAVENKMTISGYSRAVFESSKDNFTNLSSPLEADDFNSLIQWIIFVKFLFNNTSIHEIRHYLNVLNKYFSHLDFELQNILDPVRQNLGELLKKSKIDMESSLDLPINEKYSLEIQISSLNFDYKKFSEYLKNT